MDMTSKQFEKLLRSIVADEVDKRAGITDAKIDSVQTSVDGLAAKMTAHLDVEWHVHLKELHPRIESRIKRIERKLRSHSSAASAPCFGIRAPCGSTSRTRVPLSARR